MANYNFNFLPNPPNNPSISGAGSLKIEQQSNQFILKIRSGKIRGKFHGKLQSNDQDICLATTPSDKGNLILQEGCLSLTDVHGANQLEGNLDFVNEQAQAFSLFVKGVFKNKLTDAFSFSKGATSKQNLLCYFTFNDDDITIK